MITVFSTGVVLFVIFIISFLAVIIYYFYLKNNDNDLYRHKLTDEGYEVYECLDDDIKIICK